ncbi:MAG: MDR family MFS transporter [Polyangiales bacterium]
MSIVSPLAAFGALRDLPRAVWVTGAASLVNRLGTMALPFLVLYLVRDRGYSLTQSGLFLSLYGATALLAAPVSGRLCDRLGAKRVMVASFVATGGIVTAVPWARGTLGIATLVCGWALANETFRPAMMTHLGTSTGPELRKQAFALNRWAVNLGMSVGPAVGGFLAARSFKLVFLVDGLTTWIAVAILALGLPATPAAPSPTHDEARGLPRKGLSDRRLLIALLAQLPLAILFFQMESTVPMFVVDHLQLTPATFGLMATINTVMIVFLEIPINHAAASWSHRRTLVVGALFTAAGFGVYGLAHGFPVLAAATAIWTMGEMIGAPGLPTYVAEIAPPDRRGEYMGLLVMTYSLAFIVAPWAGTQLFTHLGARLLWPVLAALGALAALLFSRIPSHAATTREA